MHARRAGPNKLRVGLVALVLLGGGPLWASESSDKAQRLIDRGDLRTATIELKSALQKNPQDAEARLLLGRLHLRSGNGPAAEKEIRAAIDLGIDARRFRLDLVEAMILQSRFEDAMRRLDNASDLTLEEETRALALRGDAALGRDRVGEARDYYERALSRDPDNQQAGVGLLRLGNKEGDVAETIRATDAFLERFPNNVDALLIRADFYRADGDSEKSLELLERVLKQDPRHIVAMLGKASALIALKDYERARVQLNNIDAAQRNIPLVGYLRGLIAFQEKNWKDASDLLERVLTQVPHHAQSQVLLGIIRFSEGDLEMADELLGSALAVMPDNLTVLKVLGATYIKMRKAEDAIALLRPYAGLGDSQLLALLGSAYMLQGDLESGQEWLTKSVEGSPDLASLRTQLALTLLAGGQTGQAIEELKSAVDLGQDVLQADVLLVLAQLKDEKFDEAVAASLAFEERLPDSPVPYNLTGLVYLAKGDLDNARERFEKARGIDPTFATAQINLARIDLTNGDPDSARERYEQILEHAPKHLGALLGLAALAEQRGDSDALVAALERAQDANPTASEPGVLLARYYISRGDHLRARTIANDLTARFPDSDTALEILARAQTLSGQVSTAVSTFEQLASRSPKQMKYHYLLGGAYWKNQEYRKAQDAFRRALNLQADFVDAWMALASVSLDAGDSESALSAAQALQTRFPESARGYQVEAKIRMLQGEPDKAILAVEEAYKRDKSGEIVLQLAETLQKSGRPGEAVEHLQPWMEQHPDDLDAGGYLGMLLQQLGRDPEAIAAYERVLANTDKPNPLLLNNLAWLYFEKGDERALNLARRAYDMVPNRPEVADTYGWILFSSGEQRRGLSILQQAYLAFPNQMDIGYHVGAALKGQGRNDEAVQILRKVLREGGDSPTKSKIRALLDELGG